MDDKNIKLNPEAEKELSNGNGKDEGE